MYKKVENKKIEVLKNAGFTVVETLVAIAILTLSIAGTFTAVQKGLQSSTYAKDQIVAFNLIQEGMEFIRNKRDENALRNIGGQGNNWLTGLSDIAGDPCFYGRTCTIDSYTEVVTNYPGGAGTSPVLNVQTSTGLLGYTSGAGWVPTSFKREIQFQEVLPAVVPPREVNVIITISWTDRGVDRSLQIIQTLFNRQ
ncbi:MAG: prepilin-type N-terminal cleavage/methylation domain-containing protein [Minisyncoccia bacterium]